MNYIQHKRLIISIISIIIICYFPLAIYSQIDINELIEKLRDNDPSIRANAAKLLGELKDSQAVEPLIKALKDNNLEVQCKATEALGEIKDIRAIKPLIIDLQDRYGFGVDISINALKRIGKPAIESLIVALKETQNKDTKIRENIKRALMEIGEPAIEPLITSLKNENWFLRQEAASLLGELKNIRAVEPLITNLEDQDFRVSWAAALALGKIKDVRAVESLIVNLKKLGEKNVSTREGAAFALGEVKDMQAVEPLIAVLKEDKYSGPRTSSAFALGELKDIRAVEPLIAALKDKNFSVRWNTAKALGKLKDMRAVEPLIIALKDKSPYVRCEIVKAFGEIKDYRAVDPLIIALKDGNTDVRWYAAEALGKLKDPHAIKSLVDTLKEKDRNISNNIIQALRNIGKPGVEQLKPYLKDEDPYVQKNIAKLLDEITKQQSIDKKEDFNLTFIQKEKKSKEILQKCFRIAYLKNKDIWISTIDEKNEVIKKEQITKEGNITNLFGWNYDNSKIIYATGQVGYMDEMHYGPKGYNLWSWDVKEQKKINIVGDSTVTYSVKLSPKDNKIVYVQTVTNDLYLVYGDEAAAKPERIVKKADAPKWSHNGENVAYVGYGFDNLNDSFGMYENMQLGIYNFKDKKDIFLKITVEDKASAGIGDTFEYYPRPSILGWKFNNDKILFDFSTKKAYWAIGIMDTINGEQKILYDSKYGYSISPLNIKWIDENRFISYGYLNLKEESVIIISNIDLKEQKIIKKFLQEEIYNYYLDISNDKLKLVYYNKKFEIFVINIDSKEEKKIDAGEFPFWEN
ncbi:MAG: HEAT repeat domain-containing protein [Candidatus Firestonebacteria bacterium]|nr:HEAT repeat domain-containing protein [Candidatus Firestonebacteria bacterium]